MARHPAHLCCFAAEKNNRVTIRGMIPTDLDFCVENVTREGWLSETRDTFEMFFAHDSGGCYIAEEQEAPIGICVATAYETSGFLGELIVVHERRGQSVGRQLLEHAIGCLRRRGCASIYIDGDLPAVPLYERLGFRTLCDSLRFVGHVEPRIVHGVRPLSATDLAAIYDLDREAFGADRSFLIRHKLMQHPALTRGLECEGKDHRVHYGSSRSRHNFGRPLGGRQFDLRSNRPAA